MAITIKTFAHAIVDQNGFVQLQTIRSNPARAWEALLGRKLTPRERAEWKKTGFRVAAITVESSSK